MGKIDMAKVQKGIEIGKMVAPVVLQVIKKIKAKRVLTWQDVGVEHPGAVSKSMTKAFVIEPVDNQYVLTYFKVRRPKDFTKIPFQSLEAAKVAAQAIAMGRM